MTIDPTLAAGDMGGLELTRKGSNDLAQVFVTTDPELVRARVLEGGAQEFCTGLIEALKRRHPKTGRVSERWAYLLFAKICKLVGVQVDIAMLVVQQVGVPLPEARALVEQHRETEGMSEAELAERMRSWLARYDAARLSGSTNGTGLVSELGAEPDRGSEGILGVSHSAEPAP